MTPVQIRETVVEVEIKAPRDRVWRALMEELSDWWPQDFLCFPEAQRMSFEPRAGGRMFEETADGRQILWATVVLIVPGHSMEFVGHTTPTYGGPNVNMTRLEVKDGDTGSTLFRLLNSVLGKIDDEQEANLTEGWKYLFATSFKGYVEASE